MKQHGALCCLVVACSTVLSVAAGCAGRSSKVPAGGDPERMSESEYDIAKDLWLRRNLPREALSHTLDAVELEPDNADAHHLAALLYLDLCRRSPDDCRLGEAERHARLAIKGEEHHREATNTLGVVLIHRKKYDAAIAVLKPLTADILYETPENAWGNLGWAYLEKGSVDLAIDALRHSVAAQPLFCVGNYRLGVAYEKKHEPAQALASLTRALETDHPACRALQDAVFARARVLASLGEMNDARDDLDRCVAMEKSSPVAKDCASMLEKLK